MYAKVLQAENKVILAAADKELVGKVFEEGAIRFEVKESFYKGKQVTEEELVDLMEDADSMNLVGDKTIAVAVSKGFVDERSVKNIHGARHVQVYKV